MSAGTKVRLADQQWPELPLDAWKDTLDSLHLYTQVVGKVRLAYTPLINHWWNVALYVTARGLTTRPLPYRNGAFEVDLDFIDHTLAIRSSWGSTRYLGLVPRTVADFYKEFLATLEELDIRVDLNPKPQEMAEAIPFDQDQTHAAYDQEFAERWWRALLSSELVFREFRARFQGKCSPVHFFWGSFDLAVSRFSGRRAPPRPGADRLTREAYSHEVSSVGFWPGGGPVSGAAFYSYIVPEPAGFQSAPIAPAKAYYSQDLHEFVLPYDDLRASADPRQTLLDFCQSTYEAGATLGGWDRSTLERPTEPAQAPQEAAPPTVH